MLDVEELEKRWVYYKLKRIIPYAIFLISTILLYLFIVIFIVIKNKIDSPDKVTKESNVTNIVNVASTTKSDKKIVVKKSMQDKVLNDKVILEPSLNFIKRMQNDTVVYHLVGDKKSVQKMKIQTKQKVLSQEIEKQKSVKKVIEKEKPQKNKILISKERHIQFKKTVKADIKDIVKRFSTNRNPTLSLFIAKHYYSIKDYHKSYDYALITNKLNSDMEESWLLFAKSLVKLGEKERAVDMLNKYINHTYSKEAKLLREKINSGKFK